MITLDTINLTLTQNITNSYGYGLDGNNDGLGGDNYSQIYYTSMLGDFNNDMTITVEDVSQFIINWENKDYEFELGPFSGEIPHVSVQEDFKYNFEDMVGFAMMWNWYNTNNTMTFANYEDQGEFIDIEAEHDSIYFDIPNSLSAYQIQINYQPGDVFINNGKTNQEKIQIMTGQKF